MEFRDHSSQNFYFSSRESRRMNSLFIILFCSEGDNLPEAYAMLNKLDAYLNFSQVSHKFSNLIEFNKFVFLTRTHQIQNHELNGSPQSLGRAFMEIKFLKRLMNDSIQIYVLL